MLLPLTVKQLLTQMKVCEAFATGPVQFTFYMQRAIFEILPLFKVLHLNNVTFIKYIIQIMTSTLASSAPLYHIFFMQGLRGDTRGGVYEERRHRRSLIARNERGADLISFQHSLSYYRQLCTIINCTSTKFYFLALGTKSKIIICYLKQTMI